MTDFNISPEPVDLTVVYSKHVTLWKRIHKHWYCQGDVKNIPFTWCKLLTDYGPLTTDIPPFAVGEYISFQDFWIMPIGSVVKEKHYAAMTRTNYGVIFGGERITSPSNYSQKYMKNLQILHIGEEDE